MGLTATDLMLVQRGETSYKITGSNLTIDIIDNLSTTPVVIREITNNVALGNLDVTISDTDIGGVVSLNDLDINLQTGSVNIYSETDKSVRIYTPTDPLTTSYYVEIAVPAGSLTQNVVWQFPNTSGTVASANSVGDVSTRVTTNENDITALEVALAGLTTRVAQNEAAIAALQGG